jgi:hypothetical protein
LLVVKKCKYELPQTEGEDGDAQVKQADKKLASKDRHKPAEKEESPTESVKTRLH